MKKTAFVSAALILLLASACSDKSFDQFTDAAVADDLSADTTMPADMAPDGSGFSPEVEQELQQMLEDFIKVKDLVGGTLAVQLGQDTLWTGAAGMSDLDAETKMESDDLIRIFDITEVFVATLLLKLVEEDLLSVDDMLIEWVPDFPEAEKIPLYTLLNHTSGVGVCELNTGTTPDGCLQQASLDELPFTPGTARQKTGANYILIGKVIEAVTGEDWQKELHDRILYTYSLRKTFIGGYDTITGTIAKHYSISKGIFRDVYDYWRPDALGAAGCMLSTASDLTHFYNLLHGGKILSPATLHKMREEHNILLPADDEYWKLFKSNATSIECGLGFYTKEEDGEIFYFHDAAEPGTMALVSRRKRDGLTVAMLINQYCYLVKGFPCEVPTHELANKVFALFP